MANTHEAVWEWLQACPHIKDLFFNYARAGNGDTMLIPLTAYNDTLVQEFIGAGCSERRYDFSLIRFDAISDAPNSTENIRVLLDVEQIAAWIDQQDVIGNYPHMPEGCTVTQVAAYPPGTDYFAAQHEGQAKFLFQFHIDYLKEV